MLKAILRGMLSGRAARRRGEMTLENALALVDQGRLADAESALHALCIAHPDDPEARTWLGRVLYRQARTGPALAVLEQAVELAPSNADAQYLLGRACIDTGAFRDAAAALRRTTQLEPAWGPGWLALADALEGMGEIDAAEDHYLRAIELAPGLPEAACNYGNLLNKIGRVDEALVHYRRAIELKPGFGPPYPNLLFALTRTESATPEQVFHAHLEWAQRFAEPLTAAAEPHAPPRPHARLRVGYVSADFRDHPVTYFFEPVLRHHDAQAFEIFCYSDVRVPDARTERLRSRAALWRETHAMADEALVRLVREDRIDILVDLAGHTRGDRLLAFARRAAPVQITWMGYPNTTGMSAMDYRISDCYADPPGMTESLHSERLLRMPEIYMPFAVPIDDVPVGPAPALERGHVSFGSFNAAAKRTPRMMRLWARVLRAVPQAHLIMLDVPEGRTRERTRDLLIQEGIAPGRLDLRGHLPYRAFWNAHNEVDIALDTYCNGTTTTAHALWMGVPLVTLAGRSHAARVALSMLSNAGFPRLAAATEDEYVAIAAGLAQDVPRLQDLRAGMRARMLASPNMDGARFTRFLESAYVKVWEDYRSARR